MMIVLVERSETVVMMDTIYIIYTVYTVLQYQPSLQLMSLLSNGTKWSEAVVSGN